MESPAASSYERGPPVPQNPLDRWDGVRQGAISHACEAIDIDPANDLVLRYAKSLHDELLEHNSTRQLLEIETARRHSAERELWNMHIRNKIGNGLHLDKGKISIQKKNKELKSCRDTLRLRTEELFALKDELEAAKLQLAQVEDEESYVDLSTRKSQTDAGSNRGQIPNAVLAAKHLVSLAGLPQLPAPNNDGQKSEILPGGSSGRSKIICHSRSMSV